MPGETLKNKEEKFREFLSIWRNYKKELVMKKIPVTEAVYNMFLTKAIIRTRKELELQEAYFNKRPFSENEDDYGTILRWGPKYENGPIADRMPTELEIAAEYYIQTLKKKKDGRHVEHADKKKSNTKPVLSDVGNYKRDKHPFA